MLLAATLLAAGCTTLAEIRTHHKASGELIAIDADKPSTGCAKASSTTDARAYSIEDYQKYWAGFVEFDDEGWLYDPHGQQTQIAAVQARLRAELNNPRYGNTDFLVVAFVHGWHHNAHDTDCNVHEFRALLKVASDRYANEAALHPGMHPRRIVGIYAGWRGESIDIEGLNVTTVLDRRNAAERVAKGDVRALFALLRKLQVSETQKADPAGGPMRALGCRPTVYRPPAVQLQNGVRVAKDERAAAERERTAPVFPDMLILVNPAFEATRFESLHALMRPNGCDYPEDRPKVVVVTADNDRATGAIFHAGRKVLTLLEAYPRESGSDENASRERDANTHAIGFTQRYLTHRLCLVGEGPNRHAVAALTSPAAPDWQLDAYAPVWVVRAPPAIVNGHNGFFFAEPEPGTNKQQPYLLNWLVGLHLLGPGPGSPVMTTASACPPSS